MKCKQCPFILQCYAGLIDEAYVWLCLQCKHTMVWTDKNQWITYYFNCELRKVPKDARPGNMYILDIMSQQHIAIYPNCHICSPSPIGSSGLCFINLEKDAYI
jgi:hypothetical protein